MEYLVTGTITIEVEKCVEATSERDAIMQVRNEVVDYYHLDVKGAMHDPAGAKIVLSADEVSEED